MKEDNSYPFNVWSGLLEHRERIGHAIWEFLWCLSRITKEYEDGGIKWGVVLGGKPVKLNEIAKDLQESKRTALRNLQSLVDEGYLETTRTPFGVVIRVRKSKKWRKLGEVTKMSPPKIRRSDRSVTYKEDIISDRTRLSTNVDNLADARKETINTIPSLTAYYASLVGRRAHKRDYAVIGRLCKEFTPDTVRAGLDRLKEVLEHRSDIRQPLWYLRRILSCKDNKERLREELQKLMGGFSNLQRRS